MSEAIEEAEKLIAQRLKKEEEKREQYANLTPEQKRKYDKILRDRKWRANLSPEQREKQKETQREWYRNLTPKQLLERKKASHERYLKRKEAKQ